MPTEWLDRVTYPHHRQIIESLRDRSLARPEILALVVVGSVARGEARADSDVDCVLVLTDEAYQRQSQSGRVLLDANDLGDDAAAHVGGSVVDLPYLRAAAERGPEPTRYAYTDAMVIFSRDPTIAPLLAQIPVYPEHERTEKLQSFVSQLPVHFSYLELGEYSRNPYILAETAVQLVLFGGRLILAHNRMLYPNRKQFFRVLERAPEKPAGFLDLASTLLERPSIAAARAFLEAVEGFASWPGPPEGRWARYVRDVERRWQFSLAPLADS
jgi:hypothetical protein